jgi:hypothetical protein
MNPYLGLYEIIKENGKVEPSFFIAKITSPLPNLKVSFNNIELDKDNLLVDKWLVDRNEDLFTENATANVVHKHQLKDIQDKLNIGDKVVLLRIDEKFIVLSKVVSI